MANNDYAFFYNSENHDRVYDADSFSTWLKKFFTTGVFRGELEVLADGGMDVRVTGGYANVEGKVRFFETDTELTLDTASSSYQRVDTIVVERNDTERNITIKYVKGDNGGAPKPPVREEGIYQLVLAQITVEAGATSITQGHIVDTRDNDELCGVVGAAATVGDDSVVDIVRQGLTFTATRKDGSSFTFDQQDTVYTLPTASSSVLGGVKVGSNLSISNGVLSAKDASSSQAGYISAADKTKLNNIQASAKNIKINYSEYKTASLGAKADHTITVTKPSDVKGTVLACIPIGSGARNYDKSTFLNLSAPVGSSLGNLKEGKFNGQTMGGTASQVYTCGVVWIWY